MSGKLIIFSAPSGAGKSTIVNYLLERDLDIEFSISATSRSPRGKESHGKDYYFLTVEEFHDKIKKGEFVEYEEVYTGCYYGTLKEEVDRIMKNNRNVIFDVDVVGGLNIKKQYGDKALAIFISPPDLEELERRLRGRATDTPEMIRKRIDKAEYEMTFAPQFDKIIVNKDLDKTKTETEEAVKEFLGKITS